MIDEEGIQKDRWREDPFDQLFPGRENDSDGDASSNYSSCEGSDLERYCSANSALGSASVCSSVENYRDILDSCKNLSSFGEDLLSGGGVVAGDKPRGSHWNGDATTSCGAVDCLLDEKVSSSHLLSSGGMNSSKNLVSSEGMHEDINGVSASGGGSDPLPAAAQDLPVSGEDCSAQEVLGAEGDGGNSGELASDNPMRSGTAVEADEEHSEGEDSMLDSGTDDERRSGIFLHDRHSFRQAEETKNNENPLLMNSSVAFGSNDWDGFVQETGDGGLTYLFSCGGQAAWQSLGPSATEVTAANLERCCSANLALGGNRICSSVENCHDLLDSCKDLTSFGEDLLCDGSGVARDKLHRSLWNGDATTSGGRVDCLLNEKDSSLHLFSSCGTNSSKNLASSEGLHADSNGISATGSGSGPLLTAAQGLPVSSEVCSAQEVLGTEGDGRSSGELACDDPMRSGTAVEADEEHLEGEDSMLDSGTDDEGRSGIFLNDRHSFQHAEETKNNENPLIMNSSVAFGSNDWDGFVQETGDGGLTYLSSCGDQPAWQSLGPSEMEGNISLLSMNHAIDPLSDKMEQEEDARDLPAASFRLQVAGHCNPNERTNCGGRPLSDYEVSHAQKPLSENYSSEGVTDLIYDGGKGETSSMHSEVVAVIDANGTPPEGQVFGESATHSDVTGIQFSAASRREFQGKESGFQEGGEPLSFLSMVVHGQDSGAPKTLNEKSKSVDMVEDDLVLDEVKNLDANDSYYELVLEMEDILLDSRNSHGTRFTLPDSGCIAQQSYHLSDGRSAASTSETDYTYPIVQYPSKIDRVEVVGARQRKGDVSFGERLVGVKEHTLYILRVWSGKDRWEVERRYRDFHALYQQLRILFIESGLALPPPWSIVERQSRKIFGNASPNIVSERTMLIQDCLRSILNSIPFGTPSPLACFLTPGKVVHNPSLLKALIPQSLQKARDNWILKVSNCEDTVLENVSTLGKTMSLVVEIKPRKSTRQLLDSQHYTCAGCHTQLDAGKTLMGELVQTLRWNKPRFCEYTGQLFCASCHTNDRAVLPARVLNLWDFSSYPVSHLAKAYLESIYDQNFQSWLKPLQIESLSTLHSGALCVMMLVFLVLPEKTAMTRHPSFFPFRKLKLQDAVHVGSFFTSLAFESSWPVHVASQPMQTGDYFLQNMSHTELAKISRELGMDRSSLLVPIQWQGFFPTFFPRQGQTKYGSRGIATR